MRDKLRRGHSMVGCEVLNLVIKVRILTPLPFKKKGITMTKYIYTAEDCPRCETLKSNYDEQNIEYMERSSERLTSPTEDRDEIDIEAFAQLNMQNLLLPVEVNVEK